MLSIIIIIILIGSFFVGWKRGFILQLLRFFSFFISLFVAFYFYRDMANFLRLWFPSPDFSGNGDSIVSIVVTSFDIESVYYAIIAFFILFILTKILLNIVGSALNVVARIPVFRTVNRLFGALLAFLEAYLILFVILVIVSFLPMGAVQQAVQQSIVAQWMIHHTPLLSDWLHGLWLTEMYFL